MGSVNVHCIGVFGDEGGDGGCSGDGVLGRWGGLALLACLFGSALPNADVNVGGNRDELIKGPDRPGSVHQLVLDVAGEMLVEAISEIGGRVAGAIHHLLELGGILGDGLTSLPERQGDLSTQLHRHGQAY